MIRRLGYDDGGLRANGITGWAVIGGLHEVVYNTIRVRVVCADGCIGVTTTVVAGDDIGDVTVYGLRKGNWMSFTRHSCGAFVNMGSRIWWCSTG